MVGGDVTGVACCRRMTPRQSCRWLVAALSLTLTLLLLGRVEGGELTFELPDKEQMCFHETVEKGVKCMLEFQVVQGGNYDVDLTLHGPGGTELYSERKRQYDRHEWTADTTGEYRFCFSNEFSTFTHKIVYFDFQAGDEDSGRIGSQSPIVAMTQMETSVLSVHQSLKVVIDYQTHHKLREAQGRGFAEDLNERVAWWSVGLTAVILASSVGQILVLRSFFTERKPHGTYGIK